MNFHGYTMKSSVLNLPTDTNSSLQMSHRIMVIDDEVDICAVLTAVLKGKGHQVCFAVDVRQGEIKLQQFQPNLLFLDINIGDKSGLDFIKTAKAICPGLKIIMISAYDGNHERSRAAAEGADGFVSKPFTTKTILAEVEKMELASVQKN